ncbi:MAG: response regulator transcription factor [Pseudorhodoplanes sp.]
MDQETFPDGEIFIVDDDPLIRDMLSTLFTLEGYQVESFPEGATFLAAARTRKPACVLLDVNMPGRSGIEILKELNASGNRAPVFMISGQGDVPLAVSAIKSGAVDFLEKPFSVEAVLDRVREALAAEVRNDDADSAIETRIAQRSTLTTREREVLTMIAGGASNKETGRQLKISPRTVEVHRARIMSKLGAKNTADLVRIVFSESTVRTNGASCA